MSVTQKEKTALEWFELAASNDFFWANAAIENYKNLPLSDENATFKTLADALISGFNWILSREGRSFWLNIYISL